MPLWLSPYVDVAAQLQIPIQKENNNKNEATTANQLPWLMAIAIATAIAITAPITAAVALQHARLTAPPPCPPRHPRHLLPQC